MGTLHFWILLLTILICFGNIVGTQEKLDNISMLKTISNEEISEEDEVLSPNYVLPKQIFNDGKPFYVQKDPISGQFDFSSKKPAGIEPEYNEVVNQNEKIVLSATQPNIHDFLNLPVKYSSSKFVYPLVSSSYANLKYQGSNLNYQNHHIGNHQNAVVPTISTTKSPKYYTKDVTTKVYSPIISTTKGKPATSATSKTTRRTTTKTTTTTNVPITTHRPSFDKLSTKFKFSPTKKFTIPLSTTTKRSSTEKQNKYTRVSIKITTPLPTKPPLTTQIINEHTTISTTTMAHLSSTTPRSSTKVTTSKPYINTNPEVTTEVTRKPITTVLTTLLQKTKGPTQPIKVTSETPPFIPMASENPIRLDINTADIYNKVQVKNESNKMSLADIFSALAEGDNYDQSDNSQSSLNQGLDKQGNLIQPISPSVPSPFTLHQVTKVAFPSVTSKKPYITTIPVITRPSQTEKPLQIFSDVGKQKQQDFPQQNRVQYHPFPSMNNIVISPDQNSASFVLGSQQAVDSNIFVGSVKKEPLFENNRPIQFGTVINEDINQITETRPLNLPLNQNLQAEHNQIYNMQQFQQHLKQNPTQDHTQELLVSTNIRFPNDVAFSEQEDGQYIGSSNTVNGHAQPVSMSPNAPRKPVVFPNVEQELEKINNENETINNIVNKKIVFQQHFTQTERPLIQQKQEILTLNQHNLHIKNFPQLPEDLTPPDAPDQTNRLPPSDQIPNRHLIEQTQQLPHQSLQRPEFIRPPHLTPPGNYLYSEFARKPNGYRPHSDRPLPNILPQFRPNAKISQGHPTYNKDPGSIRVSHSKYPPSKRGLPPPQYTHRRTPINNVGTNRYPIKLMVERPQESNRRVYKVSVPHPHFFSKQYLHRPPPPHTRIADPLIDERHANLNLNRNPYNGYPESEAISERLPSFEEDDYVVNDSGPPQPILNNREEHKEEMKEDNVENTSKLEPVVTLQMLHSQKKTATSDTEDNVSENKQSSFPITGPNQGVYVVYPELSMAMENQVDVIKNDTSIPELMNSSSGAAADYQNTPFSVVRDHPQEPILMVKNKPQLKNKDMFPYPMEKPDIAYAEFSKKHDYDLFNRETSLDPIPRVVNRRNDNENNHYQQSTEIPIAIAYTPTEPNRHPSSIYNPSKNNKYSFANFANPHVTEIHDTQTEAAAMIHDEYDTRGQNYEKDFMAPFYPSMSLDPATDSPNGWSVFQLSTTDKSNNPKINIKRSDSVEKNNSINGKPLALTQIQHAQTETEITPTKKYDQGNFQPELQGGFKPIYPPGYKTKDEVSSDEVKKIENLDTTILKLKSTVQSDAADRPTEKIISEPIPKNNIPTVDTNSTITPDSTTSQLSVTTEVTTTSLKEKKKKPTSLAALLFGDYDDYDYEEKPANSIDKNS